jgi:hypothetical protein
MKVSKDNLPTIVEIPFRAKALYLSTLPLIDKVLVPQYIQVLFPGEIAKLEYVQPIANTLLTKFLWWYIKLFESQISNNKNQSNLFKYTLFSLAENNFRFDPENQIDEVDAVTPPDVLLTNWFERELVSKFGKNDLLTDISNLSFPAHYDSANKIWETIWELNSGELNSHIENLVKEMLSGQ